MWYYVYTKIVRCREKKFIYEKSIDELNQEFENSVTPICYITHCKDTIFKSQRDFTLTFDELEKVEDFTDYYFIEFIK